MATGGLTYADAGVDIEAGNALVERIKPASARTSRPGSVAGLGGFGGLFDLKAAGYEDPIIVAATDGVGTKLKVAIEGPANLAASASISWQCASTIWFVRVPSRSSSSTILRPGVSMSTARRR